MGESKFLLPNQVGERVRGKRGKKKIAGERWGSVWVRGRKAVGVEGLQSLLCKSFLFKERKAEEVVLVLEAIRV